MASSRYDVPGGGAKKRRLQKHPSMEDDFAVMESLRRVQLPLGPSNIYEASHWPVVLLDGFADARPAMADRMQNLLRHGSLSTPDY